MRKKVWRQIGQQVVLPVLTAVLCARLLLRGLSFLLFFDPQFSAIFAQIAEAEMRTPLILVLLAVLVYLLLSKLGTQNARRALAGRVLLWPILMGATMLLTRVNGIRFCDVLFSLLDVLQKGGL